MTRLGQRFFGLPKPFAPFARHRIWEVHSSVTAVVSFEKAHPPAGLSGGCGAKAGGDGGVGVVCGPNVPANAGLQFTLPPIRGRVESRRIARAAHDHPRAARRLDGDSCRCRQSSLDARRLDD